MFYISEIVNKKVWDAWGKKIGRCDDLLVGLADKPVTPILAVAIQNNEGKTEAIPSSQISSLYPSITLKVPYKKFEPYSLKGSELWLEEQVLDHQIVDVEGRRVVRVNDIQIAYMKDGYVITGVDVSNLGLLRRMGLERIAEGIGKIFNKSFARNVIAWKDVAYVEEKDPLRLNKSREKISKLPPADIAMILSDLDRPTGHSLVEEMTNEILADTLEESPVKTQIEVLSKLDIEKAVDVLEEMEPDEAADLLSDMPADTSNELLKLMEEEEAEDIRTLLDYPSDTAGGIMTTDFAWINKGLTAGEAIEFLRSSEDAHDVEEMYYVYVLEENKRSCGVIYLRDLVMASPGTAIDQLMDGDPISVSPETPQSEVAYLVAKYDLLALPVVNEETGEMLGIVTLDDAIDSVLPTAYKKRLPRFF